MARPRQMSDDEILDIARDCFFKHGAHVSTSHIAAEVGLSQAALFKRFKTKENLLISALLPPVDIPWMTLAEAGPTEARVPEQLAVIASAAVEHMRFLMPRIMVLKSANIHPAVLLERMPEPPPRRAIRALTQLFKTLGEQGRISCSNPSVLAIQFMGTIHGRVFFHHMFNALVGPDDDAAFVELMVNNLWSGIAPKGAS